jgi:hypothetical protein
VSTPLRRLSDLLIGPGMNLLLLLLLLLAFIALFRF